MTITISPDIAERVQKAAAQKHQDPNEYVDFLLSRTLPPVYQEENETDEDYEAPAPYVRPTEPPEWIKEQLAKKVAENGPYAMRRVWGAWPGDETDEEVRAALEELS